MEPLLNQLRELTKKFNALSSALRMGILAAAVLLVLVIVLTQLGGSSGNYEYAFTNLSPEDSSEAAAQLKAAKIPFRLEAGGTALAVPATQVYDARLMLAAMGLPRGGGVGFEIFDRGDLGVSEFTQRVNLRRAIEGELARTIGRLASVRSARVHITLTEKGLYRDDDHKAVAAVVLNLQPGRTMAEKELQGVRHLVASAVTGLNPDSVTVVDGRGTVLAGDNSADSKAATQQHDLERTLEQRITDLLEPAVGQGGIIAKVSAAFDSADVETTADAYDPDGTAVRSEHKSTEQTNQDNGAGPAGIAGAVANQPGAGVPGGGSGGGSKAMTQREDETKNYEVSKTVTHTVARGPRLKRLSVAVLLDAPGGKPRPEAEVKRMEDLAKSAVGFDVKRGDQFQISSAAFSKSPTDNDGIKEMWWMAPRTFRLAEILGGFILFFLMAMALIRMRRKSGASQLTSMPQMALMKAGSRVAEVEAAMERAALPPSNSPHAIAAMPGADPSVQVRDRARELASTDPQRAAQILRGWISVDGEEAKRG